MAEEYSLGDTAREYLAAVDSSDGEASSREIRERTNLDARQVRYYHDRLAAEGFVELDKDATLTPQDVSPMTVVSLREKGRERIARGETAEEQIGQTADERLDELAAEVEEVTDLMEGAFPWMNEISARIRRIEAYLEAKGADLDEFGDIEEFEK
jgi:DNA-binding IclR family transcriptional regulator